MSRKVIFSSALALLFTAGLAQAEVAKIVSVDGKAVVERGQNQFAAKSGMFLEEGDVVRALQGNVALKYADCTSKFGATNTASMEVTVQKTAPCAAAKASTATVASSSSAGITTATVAGASLIPVLAGTAGAVAAVSSSGSASKSTSSNDAVSP